MFAEEGGIGCLQKREGRDELIVGVGAKAAGKGVRCFFESPPVCW